MSRAVGLLTCLLLGACQTNAPKPAPVPAKVIEVPVPVYVPIPDELTAPCPIARGPLSQLPMVARDRKAALEKCNSDKAAIRGVQGKPVPDKAGDK